MAVEIPSPVDENGDIALDPNEGAVIPVRTRLANGTPISMLGRNYKFVVPGRFEITLIGDPDNTDRLLLILTEEHGDMLPTTPVSFSLLDMQGVVPVAVWRGKIRRLS